MKDDKKVPQLRFPEFTDAWKQRKLRDIGAIVTGNTPKTSDKGNYGNDYLFVSPADIQQNRYIKNTQTKLTKKGFLTGKPIRKGASLFVCIGSTIGKVAQTVEESVSNQQINALIPFVSFCDDFVFTLLETLALKVKSIASNQAVPIINKSTFGSTECLVPSIIEEQQKIGAFFTQLDSTITLQQRKLNSLQKLKKGLLQKMFPKKGENIPEIRFPEFSDAWKQRKFGDSFDFLQNNTLSRASLNDTSGCAKNVHYGDILVKFGESISAEKADLPFICEREILKKLSKSILKNGDVVIADTAEDMTTGKSCEIVDVDECMPVLAGLHTIPVRPKQKFGKYYLGYYLNSEAFHSQLIPLIQGIKVYSISKSSIKDTVVMFPDDVQEQEKIGSLFNRIDNTITLQQRKLNSLQKLKKGLLQKMFPKKGENIPEIRFPEFSDAWKQRKFGDFAKVSMCKRIFKEETTQTGDVPFFKIGTFGGIPDAFISRYKFESYKAKYPYPKKGDILISASGSIGRIVEYSGKDEYFQDSNIIWLDHDESVLNSFLKHVYSIIKWNGIEGTTIKRLYNDNVLTTKILTPSLEEQSKIGAFFTQLDNTITLQQRWLFYTHKQS